MKTNQLITFFFLISITFSCSKNEPIIEPVTSNPTIKAHAPENITHISATLIGEITSDGGSKIIEKGFIYGKGNIELNSPNAIKIRSQNNEIGIYKESITDLEPYNAYRVWAYATNKNGTQYSDISMSSLQDPRIITEDIVLKSQEEINEFAKRDIISLHSLTIGEKGAKNNIDDLSKLNSIKEIRGSLFIQNTQLKNINGFENLSLVRGDTLAIRNNDKLEIIDNLENVSVGGQDLSINVQIKNSNLKKITNFGSSNSDIWYFWIVNNPKLESIEGLRNLEVISLLHIKYNPNLTSLIGLENLKEIKHDFELIANSKIQNLNPLQNLTKVKYIDIQFNATLNNIDGLQNIEKPKFRIHDNPNITSISFLSKFTDFGGIWLSRLPNLQSLDGLKNAKSMGYLLLATESSNITNLNHLSNLEKVNGNIFIAGFSVATCGIGFNIRETRDSSYDNNFIKDISGLNGLKSDTNTKIQIMNNHGLTEIPDFENLTTVNFLKIDNNRNLESVNGFKNLTGIKRELIITQNSNLTAIEGFSKLEKSGNITIKNNTKLTEINGLNNITTISDWDNLNFQDRGKLIIENIGISNLNWLSNLNKIENELSITLCSNLKNLCSLQNLLSNDGLKGSYNVKDNLFNPTKQEIIDGNCKN